MKSLVIYESMYGNTKEIGIAIGEGASSAGEVDVFEVSEAPKEIPSDVDFVFVGGPTHAFGMTRQSTRDDAPKYAEGPYISQDYGMREWLSDYSSEGPTTWATFDTKIEKPKLPGAASEKAKKRLRKNRANTVIAAETFYVTGSAGPLASDERERATEWARSLVGGSSE